VKARVLGVFALFLFLSRSATAQSAADAMGAQNQPTANATRHFDNFPIITGGIALNATFEPHSNNMNPVIAPIFLVPLGHRALIESEIEIESDITYSHREYEPVTLIKSVEYAQLDFFVNKYVTLVAGRYAVPFSIYKERFDARWIRTLSEEPLIFHITDSSGNGGQLRGAIPLGSAAQLSYAAYFSAKTTNVSAASERQSGFRSAVYLPGPRIEAGFSFNRLLGNDRFNRMGTDFTWNLRKVPVDIRSEALYSKTVGNGYWIEGAYRFTGSRFPGWMRRSQAVLRGEQYFVPKDGLPDGFEAPATDTTRVLGGWNYWITDAVRAQVAFGRQFATDDNHNVWTVGISYRFVK
jgi:hypothetical protein